MKSHPFYIRKLQGDVSEAAQAIQLFHTVFGKATSTEQWLWKYRDAPRGILLSHAAYAHATGDMVGHVGALALPGLHNGQAMYLVQFTDVMVHPSARSSLGADNLYRQLMNHTVQAMHAVASPTTPVYAYGFPGKTPAFLGARMDFYKMLGYCTQQTYDLIPSPRAWPNIFTWRLQCITDATQLPPYLMLPTQNAAARPQLVKDAQYLNWRYLNCPDRTYKLWLARPRWGRAVAWLVTNEAAPAHIIDIRVIGANHAEKNMPKLINALVGQTGVNQWTSWLTSANGHPTDTSLMAVEIGVRGRPCSGPAPTFQPGDTDVY